MRRSRTLILLGVVLLLLAILAFVALNPGQPTPPPENVPTEPPTPVIRMVKIVVAAQNIPRGRAITSDAVILADWPENSVPPGAFNNLDDVQNLIARTDILFNQPLMDVMLTNDRAQLTSRGSDAALLIPNDKRAVALPTDQLSSVAYALQPGDHVDVLVSLWLTDADRNGQYASYMFNRDLSDEFIAAGMQPETAVQTAIQLTTRDKSFPRLSSQLILQDVEVLSVGEWTQPTPIPRFTPGAPGVEPPTPTLAAAPGATPTATPPRPSVIILVVTPQQALILQWLRESDAIMDMALRGANDFAPVDTSTVTLQYLFDNFNVTLPPKLDFAVNYLPPDNSASCPERWTKDSCR